MVQDAHLEHIVRISKTRIPLLPTPTDGGDMRSETPSRELSITIARSVLEATTHLLPYQAAVRTPDHVVWAGGFVARCRQLLSAVVALVESGCDDAVGVVYRTLLETFLSGVYALLGRQEALEAMHHALLHESHLIEVALGTTDAQNRPEEANRLPVSDYRHGTGLIERVDGLLAERDTDYRGWAPAIHRTHYRVLSLHDAHGGLGCLQGYINTESGAPIIAPERASAHQAIFLLHHAIVHVASFAGLWARAANLSAPALIAALQRWEDAQPESWDPPSSD